MTKLFAKHVLLVATLLLTSLAAIAQKAPEPQATSNSNAPAPQASSSPAPQPGVASAAPEKKTAVMQTPSVRLATAKTVLITRTRGGDIPYDVIRTTIDGWGRFTLVKATDQADLVIEVASSGGNNDVRVSSTMGTSPRTGQPESGTSSTRDLSASEVSLTVIDGANKRVLWHGTQSARYAMKQKARENNLVEASEKLASRFHDRLEPVETQQPRD
jgi:hypothetical protein